MWGGGRAAQRAALPLPHIHGGVAREQRVLALPKEVREAQQELRARRPLPPVHCEEVHVGRQRC